MIWNRYFGFLFDLWNKLQFDGELKTDSSALAEHYNPRVIIASFFRRYSQSASRLTIPLIRDEIDHRLSTQRRRESQLERQ